MSETIDEKGSISSYIKRALYIDVSEKNISMQAERSIRKKCAIFL